MSTAILEVLNSGIKCITTNDEAVIIFGVAFSIIYKHKFGDIISLPDSIKKQLIDGEKIIVVQTGLKQHLTELEYLSVIAHEEGHIKLGHLDVSKSNYVYNEANELDADDYAIKLYGKQVCASALEKTYQFTINQPSYNMIQLYIKQKDRILNKMRFNIRLKRLKNLT
jgi:Zn-dependent protease with chaperone function